jgi:hypothetical protein
MDKIVTVTTDDAKERYLDALLDGIANGVPRVISGAINKVLPRARTGFARAVRERITLAYGAVLERIAIRRATVQDLAGLIIITRKGVPLSEYKARWSLRSGVTVQVRKGAAAERFPESFTRTLSSGHKGVFRRRFVGGKRVPRLPIDQRYGPTVEGVVEGAPGLLEEQVELASEDLDRQIESQVDRLLVRGKAES